MPTPDSSLIDLEKKLWQSMVDEDIDAALSLLHEPALMVTAEGALQFDHVEYRQMAEQGNMVITAFEFSDVNVMFPSDDIAVVTYRVLQTMVERGGNEDEAVEQLMTDSTVWLRKDGEWRCFMHTEAEVYDDEDDEAYEA